MKYDFTSVIDRKGKDAIAIDIVDLEPIVVEEGFSPIPMWVADMNYATAPSIVEEIEKRLKHPLFGYFTPRKEYFDSIIQWQKKKKY